MKRLFALISPLLYFISPKLAFAQGADTGGGTLDLCPPDTDFTLLCGIKSGDFGGIIGTAIIVLFILAIIIALIWLVIGGIKWITSSGDSSKVEAARNQIIAAVIGLVIVFLSYFILNFILTIFGIDGIGGIRIPTIVPIVSN
jgi:hypothetical protein